MLRPTYVWIAATTAFVSGCHPGPREKPVIDRAIAEIARCVAVGRDCGGDASVRDAPREWPEILRRSCMDRVERIDVSLERTGGKIILICEVGEVRGVYTATFDRGLPDEVRRPVVSYSYERSKREGAVMAASSNQG